MILATRFTFIVERSWKNMYLHPKLAWPPASYDVISCNHSNWPLLNLGWRCFKEPGCAGQWIYRNFQSSVSPSNWGRLVSSCVSSCCDTSASWYAFGVAWLNSRGDVLFLRFDVWCVTAQVTKKEIITESHYSWKKCRLLSGPCV